KMSQSIRELFSRQSELQIQNSTVFCPLLGTGEAGINLSKDEVITMIIGMFIDCCRRRTQEESDRIKRLNIVVYWKDFWKINWSELNRSLHICVEECRNCRIKSEI